ncbi:hypothetical protein A3F00_05470 [Candidatus Daviesbacteria bacterium RIFCSPHIGHO2_12_FULL_37_11]|uniref:Uncharacterized protein n=1 Tax=Candidatus Daviesbacteria bacterium RIFCSPHIGHO2_12_FULL_37_11 TaxID=1797777 RepID=A0A1F5KCA3_9BACT|nr:MAG: hypothetical protein A2111_00445 [Candidatus Daviesbacteria bacterium GWA1_38_6]OGE17580.1 MAG: hypothetical protein A2769_00670 [Candidatus Daviesbacteria bacterium RIFCSPHIGHO2_01_FULL_37_27]OGE38499.1 MAG: hypothetical protein A3F00_05470 [Candidatus Daviesbacteria bacterium RIFCSPHIGHO2_12_FULL_37_11]OGE45714.1 MAG: hypothetical protein A3B39_05335 [Candidatus Daviesbacteria bacterium RIFCSPLOWO2_01_FULL_37_10]
MAATKSTEIKELLEIIKHKIDILDVSRTDQSASIYLMRDQLSVMNSKFDEMGKTLNDPATGLAAINKQLNDPSTGLKRLNERIDAIWEQTTDLTEDMAETQDISNSHTKALRQIMADTQNSRDNTKKLDKRLNLIEEKSGIKIPPEFQLADVS